MSLIESLKIIGLVAVAVMLVLWLLMPLLAPAAG